MTCLLDTDRLCLRPCRVDDLDFLHELWTDADVRRILFDDRQISREEARSLIDSSTASFTKYGYGIWLFFEHHSDRIAGFAGLLQSSQEPPSLIFGTRPQLWNYGYATEAARVVLRYAFEVLCIELVIADVDLPNEVSIRVLEKLGMTLTRRAIVNSRPLLYYQLHAIQYSAT